MKKLEHWDGQWRFGANFTPSTAINQLEMWQAETFDPATIDRELGWAASIGMRLMRVFLHDLLWEQDSAGFLRRMEQYLAIAAKHRIKTMFVFFDDCWWQPRGRRSLAAAAPGTLCQRGSQPLLRR